MWYMVWLLVAQLFLGFGEGCRVGHVRQNSSHGEPVLEILKLVGARSWHLPRFSKRKLPEVP